MLSLTYGAFPDSTTIALAVALLLGINFTMTYTKWLLSPLRKIPGPERRFLLGHLPALLNESFMDPQMRWWKKSSPLISFNLPLGAYTVYILDPDIVKAVLTAPRRQLPARFGRAADGIKDIIGHSLLTMDGPVWHRHHRIAQPAFGSLSLLQEALNESVAKRILPLIQAWSAHARKDQEICMTTFLHPLALDILGDVAFSYDFKAQQGMQLNGQQDTIVQCLQAVFRESKIRPLLMLTGMTWLQDYVNINPKGRETVQTLNAAVDEMVCGAREKAHEQKSFSTVKERRHKKLFEHIVTARDSAEDSEDTNIKQPSLSDTELRDMVKTFIVAGHETTSVFAHWALYALGKFPDVQKKIAADIFANSSEGDSSFVTIEDIADMPYLSAFLKEVLRLYSPVGTVLRRTAQEETWHGFIVPAKTRLGLPIYMLHRHPDYWTKPLEFRPERWLIKEELDAMHPYCYIPFGAGVHRCIGQKLAEIQAKLVLVNIVRKFEIKLAPATPENLHLTCHMCILDSKTPIKIRVKERKTGLL